MVEVLGDGATRNTMGEAARHRCVSEFSIDHVAPRYRDLYEAVLA